MTTPARRLTPPVLVLAAVALVAACWFATSGDAGDVDLGPGTPRQGGTYVAPLSDDPPTLDPALAEDTTSVTCVLQMFDTLVRFGEGNHIEPSLAERWEISPDQRSYTFVLRRDVRFHATLGDGAPTVNGGRLLTAADVVYSFERVLKPQTASPRAMNFMVVDGADEFIEGTATSVRGLQAPGPNLVRITLKRPFAPFLATLTMTNASVVPREDAEGPSPFAKRPVGTGPFLFKSYVQGSAVEFVANPACFGGRPYIDSLRFTIDADEARQFERFLRGEVFHTTVPDPEYERTRTSKALAPYFTEVSQIGTYYLGMNVRLPPFDQQQVRRAVSLAVDKDAVVKYIRTGRVLRAGGPLPPGIPGYNSGLQVPQYDPDAAERILDEAGYHRSADEGPRTSFPPISLYIPRGESDMRVARAIQANLADVGICCVPMVNDWRTHLELVNGGKAPFFRLGWMADYLDADNFLYYEFHSSNVGVSNTCSYQSQRVDELLDAARCTTDEERRKALYGEAEQLIANDCVWICLYYYNGALVRQPFVHGLNLTPLGEHMVRFDKVWLAPQTKTGREVLAAE